jgi:rare lipoprotein A (peptidoglycan hydrolase)
MKKYLPYYTLSLGVAIITLILLFLIFPKEQVIISPLQVEKNNVRLNIEAEKNKNENIRINAISTSSAKPNSASTVRQSDNNVVKASFYTTEYCKKFNPSCRTASGEIFTDEGFTAACSNQFKLGTKFLLWNDNGSVEVVCNDRGSFQEKYGRMFDLSKAAFEKLAPLSKGVVQVEYKIL